MATLSTGPFAAIFSHPQFIPNGNWTTVGYNLYKSAALANTPQYYGPWVAVTGYQGYTKNTDIIDLSATYWDLYRVQPMVQVTLPNGTTQTVNMPASRPFFYWQPLYDVQISMLLDTFRSRFVNDIPVSRTDSTNPAEGSGGAVLPFMTDAQTTRMFLSFLPGDEPQKVIDSTVQVYTGASLAGAVALNPYVDFFPSDKGGYVDLASAPNVGDYLRVEYEAVRFTNDELRSVLLNSISALSNFGINGYQVLTSNNLYSLATPLPNRDLADIVCQIAYLNIVNAQVQYSFEHAEAWDDGKTKYTADPSRSIQAATMHISNQQEMLRHQANSYILNTRNYISRGEFESYFDVTGVLPIYALIVAGTNLAGAMGYWL